MSELRLNAFLKGHRKVEEQEHKLESLEGTVGELKVALREQAALLQKVSAQVQSTQPAARVVANE